MLQHVSGSVACILLLTTTSRGDDATPLLTAGLPAGPYTVGFHREWCIDTSRTWELSPHLRDRDGRIGRPLRIDVWYPASAVPGSQRMTLRDYLYAQPPDAYFAAANKWLQDWDENSYRGYAQECKGGFRSDDGVAHDREPRRGRAPWNVTRWYSTRAVGTTARPITSGSRNTWPATGTSSRRCPNWVPVCGPATPGPPRPPSRLRSGTWKSRSAG